MDPDHIYFSPKNVRFWTHQQKYKIFSYSDEHKETCNVTVIFFAKSLVTFVRKINKARLGIHHLYTKCSVDIRSFSSLKPEIGDDNFKCAL